MARSPHLLPHRQSSLPFGILHLLSITAATAVLMDGYVTQCDGWRRRTAPLGKGSGGVRPLAAAREEITTNGGSELAAAGEIMTRQTEMAITSSLGCMGSD